MPNAETVAVIVSTLLLACAEDDKGAMSLSGGGDGQTPGAEGGDDGDTDGSAGDGDSAGDDGDSGGEGPGTKFDLMPADAPLDDERPACEKVDLLFVIDDSFSMLDEQAQLVASFPDFVDSMRTKLVQAWGYHVGVTTTDEYGAHEAECRKEGALVTRVEEVTHQGYQTRECGPYVEGRRYMSEKDDLETTFACAAKVGNRGSNDERPLRTMERALSEDMNAPDACNEGFIRDDALLVTVLISDEEDDDEQVVGTCNGAGCYPGSGDTPQHWYDRIVEAKHGIEQNIVMLSLIGVDGPDQCPLSGKAGGSGEAGAEPSPNLIEFTQMFTNHFMGPVCADRYGEFFDDAVNVIFEACENFRPPK